jgi:EmrB/QacA subfamily drug resistance transporter
MQRPNKNLVLAAMVFAVAMTFIDQTIVAIAIPHIQSELSLTGTGSQWVINGYLLALSALFAFGGRIGDVLGRRRMVVLGVVLFAFASAMCGLTPKGSIAETWIIVFRIVQGCAAAIMFPSSVAIVISSYPVNERGKAMAVFFGISGGLTAVGPIAGGFLTEWTWRAIFWVNIPVAIIALILIWMSKPDDERRPAKIDYRGTVLITGAIGLLVLGLQQSAVWGWGSVETWAAIIIGLALGVAFLRWEQRAPVPLLRLEIFKDRGFAVDTAALGLMSVVFVPFFFFASVYAQGALGESSSNAGEYLLYWFIGFVVAAQIGGRMLDSGGVRRPLVLGSALAAVGFYLLAGQLLDLSLGDQTWYIIFSGVGLGMMLSPASTDALNRASHGTYSEVTGITQTSRNLGASLGMAILGSILISRITATVTPVLTKAGLSHTAAHRIASNMASGSASGGTGQHASHAIDHAIQLAFAHSTQTVFYVMTGIFVATFLLVVWGVPRGQPAHLADPASEPDPAPQGTVA